MALLPCFPSEQSFGKRSIVLGHAKRIEVKPPKVNSRRHGRPNQISTARFPSPIILTWLPKSLFAQFMRAANIYFLVVSILVCMPFSPTAWSSTVMPFAIVLLWTALKDLYEDTRRRRDDTAENMRRCWRFDPQTRKFQKTQWQEVLCGDLLLTLQDEVFPADVLILSADSGRAFISTANLDGETNLKERRPPGVCLADLAPSESDPQIGKSKTQAKAEQTVIDLVEAVAGEACQKEFRAMLDEPKVGFDDMGGTVGFGGAPSPDSVDAPLYAEHFCPRGCVLRNTAWLLSVAGYVGDESKSRLNVASLDAKISNLQVYLNACVKGLVSTLILFCLYAAAMAQAVGDDGDFGEFAVSFCQYWIILYQIVPISLYVFFEIVKLVLGAQINLDPQMVDPETGLHAQARTADLVEELGQVMHVFSDKTGTITQNEMRFARCCIDGQDLGEFRPRSSTPFSDDSCCEQAEGVVTARKILADSSSKLCEETRRFFLCLASCHSAQVDTLDNGELVYTSSSPDEVAFLDAAKRVGMSLRGQRITAKDGGSAVELQIDGPEGVRTLSVLNQVPFSSDRKRMSVVCELEGQLICFTKGADSVMGPLCNGAVGESVVQQIDAYAKLGLRTLVVGWKPLEASFVTGWQARLEQARGSSNEVREEKLAQCARELEHSLRLSGISAIEDRLQDGVPDAMSMLTAMNIRVWMLTGDKIETALEIARSCRLVTDGMETLFVTNATSSVHASRLLLEAKKRMEGTSAECVFVLDGSSMKYATDTEDGSSLIFELGSASRCCVCCRLAPQQKRRLVEIVRERDQARITLSIGDGANDVPMIQGAHVGIGVRGKEGNQAVQSSDIAVSQFRFLVPLLHLHGRRAYRRVATYLCYYVYKHVALSVGDMCWAHQNRFEGNIAYPEWVASCYSAFFTSFPVVLILSFDRDIPDSVALAHPELYCEGQRRMYFNARVFTVWMLSGIWHGSLAWLVPNLSVGASGPGDSPNYNKEWWIGSVASFTLVLLFVDLRLWMIALNRLSPITVGAVMVSLLIYIITMLVLCYMSLGVFLQPQIENAIGDMFQLEKAIVAVLLAPFALFFDLAVYMMIRFAHQSPLDRVRQDYYSKRCRVQNISTTID